MDKRKFLTLKAYRLPFLITFLLAYNITVKAQIIPEPPTNPVERTSADLDVENAFSVNGVNFHAQFVWEHSLWQQRVNGPLDLMSISFVGKFGKRPMHFFGMLGVLSFLIGLVILVYLSIAKTIYKEYGIGDRPLFYFGILALIIGTQLFLTGFVGEMINRNSATRNSYLIEKEI